MGNNIQPLDKDGRWMQVRDEVDRITDGLGMPVDAGIKEAVTALIALGFPTRQSCEGHVEWGFPYPWVEVCASELLDREQRKAENLGYRRRLLGLLGEFYANRNVLFDIMVSFSNVDGFGAFRLQSIGGDVAETLPEEERQEKLRLYRKEMNDFTAFLKGRFLADGR